MITLLSIAAIVVVGFFTLIVGAFIVGFVVALVGEVLRDTRNGTTRRRVTTPRRGQTTRSPAAGHTATITSLSAWRAQRVSRKVTPL